MVPLLGLAIIGAGSVSTAAAARVAVRINSSDTDSAAATSSSSSKFVAVDEYKHHSIHSGFNKLSIDVDGTKRTFTLFMPKDVNAEDKRPVVFVLHGALGNGESARWNCEMNGEAEKRKLLLIYPDAMGLHTWNVGACCGIKWRDTKDVEFISSLINYVESHLDADPNRIYVSGMSNGGMMAYRLGVELSDKIAAISPVEGSMDFGWGEPKEPVSVIAFHGKRDHVVRYDGKPGHWLFVRVNAPSVTQNVHYWVQRDHCSEPPIKESHDGFEKELYRNGDRGTEVCLYSIAKGTHTWPGGKRDRFFHPIRSKELSASEVMCDFFLSHPKRSAQ